MPSSDGVIKVRSFAKVNLALSVLGRRADGYHEIRTVYQSISLADDLEFHSCDELRLDCAGLPEVPPESNLVWKAAVALAAAGKIDPRVRIVLHKNIPSGAGLGGGSANAAAALLGLSRLWNLKVESAELFAIAAGLGSDVPFFLHGGTALGVGRGEEIYPLPEMAPAHLVVIYPGMQVPTAQAYKSLSLGLTSPRHPHKIQGFCGMLRADKDAVAAVFNDFEASILPAYPAIREAKSSLDRCGATATLLSGSGSSVFGFFVNEESALAASRAVNRETWRVFPAKTLSSAEYFHRMFGVGAGR
jgi:4-diphosphocytidyl-2-C-methyl-D-erythritol kinase